MPFQRKIDTQIKKSSLSWTCQSNFYDNYVPELHVNNVKIQMIGETDLPKRLWSFEKAEELTKNNTGLILNFALNYGGEAAHEKTN